MAQNRHQPETYWTNPTSHCPNSRLPVLVYRKVLPYHPSEENVRNQMQANDWMHGGTFKHYPSAHFHSNTHECYAALSGSTQCLYGVGPFDDESKGIHFDMEAGDIAVHAAGVAHRNVKSSDDYVYMGLYPKDAPKWNNNFCKADTDETKAKADEAQHIPIPTHDPIYGLDGPLPQLWRAAAAAT